ncbi:hypothetical protein VTO73DRAFT_8279 [Trametes versicolor]
MDLVSCDICSAHVHDLNAAQSPSPSLEDPAMLHVLGAATRTMQPEEKTLRTPLRSGAWSWILTVHWQATSLKRPSSGGRDSATLSPIRPSPYKTCRRLSQPILDLPFTLTDPSCAELAGPSDVSIAAPRLSNS